jgi:hypothetical protein
MLFGLLIDSCIFFLNAILKRFPTHLYFPDNNPGTGAGRSREEYMPIQSAQLGANNRYFISCVRLEESGVRGGVRVETSVSKDY